MYKRLPSVLNENFHYILDIGPWRARILLEYFVYMLFQWHLVSWSSQEHFSSFLCCEAIVSNNAFRLYMNIIYSLSNLILFVFLDFQMSHSCSLLGTVVVPRQFCLCPQRIPKEMLSTF